MEMMGYKIKWVKAKQGWFVKVNGHYLRHGIEKNKVLFFSKDDYELKDKIETFDKYKTIYCTK